MLNNTSYEKWMENLPNCLYSIPINNIAIPGTHDSFSYSITRKSNISPDADDDIKRIVNVFGGLATSIICRWAKTQNLNTCEQLKHGIRYFDVRLSINNHDDDIYTCHTLFGQPLSIEFQAIYEFLQKNKKEIIILDFNHYYNFKPSHHTTLLHMIEKTFDDLLVPFTFEIPSLWNLWKTNQRIFIFYHIKGHKEKFIWPGSFLPSPWADTDCVKKLLTFLEKRYYEHRHLSDKFYVTQGILTPTAFTIFRYIFRNLENSLAKAVAPEFLKWLSTTSAGMNKTNCVIVDFFNDTDYVKRVVELNNKYSSSMGQGD